MNREWFCKRCGHCCNSLKDPLDVFKDEVNLFPKERMIKYIGYGDSKSDITIFIYRMIGKKCPMYDKDIGCTIYEDRPLVCRKFPFNQDPRNPIILGIDNGCRNGPKGQGKLGVSEERMKPYLEVIDKYYDQNKEILSAFKTTNVWIFKKFKWKILTIEKTAKMMERGHR